jgi:hypothetical protein
MIAIESRKDREMNTIIETLRQMKWLLLESYRAAREFDKCKKALEQREKDFIEAAEAGRRWRDEMKNNRDYLNSRDMSDLREWKIKTDAEFERMKKLVNDLTMNQCDIEWEILTREETDNRQNKD